MNVTQADHSVEVRATCADLIFEKVTLKGEGAAVTYILRRAFTVSEQLDRAIRR